MNATLSSDGKIILPHEVRDSAQLKPGDVLEVQFHKGTIVLRKHQPLTPEQCAALLEQSRSRRKQAAMETFVLARNGSFHRKPREQRLSHEASQDFCIQKFV